jgi:copper homeostasis protein
MDQCFSSRSLANAIVCVADSVKTAILTPGEIRQRDAFPRYLAQIMSGSLEIPIEDVESARIAVPHADRLEVCDDLESDGWSPSVEKITEVVRAVSEFSIEVVALIRPRCCPDFMVSSKGISQARADIEAASQASADGVVFGFLDERNHLDRESSLQLAELARSLGMSASLHRVFDFDEDYDGAVRLASECGVERILTSGSPKWSSNSTSLDLRIHRIKKIVHSSVLHGSRLERAPVQVVACGGVRADNAMDFLRATPDLHASCREGGRLGAGSLCALAGILSH